MNLPEIHEADIPQSVIDYPSMSTSKEMAFLYWLARNHFTGDGVIVDAGLFLGASTNAFAEGIKANPNVAPREDKPILSYDIAIWTKGMHKKFLAKPAIQDAMQGRPLKPGQSFGFLLSRLLERHESLVQMHIGDIVETARTDQTVEIAFFDCLKTDRRDLAVFRAFAPHYKPGHSIIIQQDYFYTGAAYNKIRQEYFSSYFEYLGQLATSAVFRLKEPIPKDLVETDPVSALSVAEKCDLLNQAIDRARGAKYEFTTRLTLIELLLKEGEFDWARNSYDQMEQKISRMTALTPKRRQRIERTMRRFRRQLAAAR